MKLKLGGGRKMYTIGQLSKKTGVTVRTLDYYDEIKLISPSSTTSGGHRLYEEKDVIRLQQVLALKYMGFSLQKIKAILKGSVPTWKQSVEQQLEYVQRKKVELSVLEQSLKGIMYSIEFEKEVKWSVIFDIIHVFQESPNGPFKLYEEYFSKEELEKIITMQEKHSDDMNKEWIDIIQEVKEHLDENPASKESQRIVKRWMEQVHKMFGHDEQLLSKMWAAMKDQKEGMASYPMDQDVMQFIEKAMVVLDERESEHGE